MNSILIDSDILLDFFLQREPFVNEAAEILSCCESGKAKGFVTGLIIANTYYLLRKHFNQKTILDDFKNLLTFLDVLVIDKNVVLQSIDSDFGDFEDALQNYSAEKYGSISTIITRNVKDYKKSRLSIITPEMFLKTL